MKSKSFRSTPMFHSSFMRLLVAIAGCSGLPPSGAMASVKNTLGVLRPASVIPDQAVRNEGRSDAASTVAKSDDGSGAFAPRFFKSISQSHGFGQDVEGQNNLKLYKQENGKISVNDRTGIYAEYMNCSYRHDINHLRYIRLWKNVRPTDIPVEGSYERSKLERSLTADIAIDGCPETWGKALELVWGKDSVVARAQKEKAENDAIKEANEAKARRATKNYMPRVAENVQRVASAIKNNSSPEIYDIENAVTSASMELSENALGLLAERIGIYSYTIDKAGRVAWVVKRDITVGIKDIKCVRVELGHSCKYLERVDYRLHNKVPLMQDPIPSDLKVGNYRERSGIFKWGTEGLEVVRGDVSPVIGFLDQQVEEYKVTRQIQKGGSYRNVDDTDHRTVYTVGSGKLLK